MMRPITILQAVGAFLVGYLVASSPSRRQGVPRPTLFPPSSIVLAAASVYLSYGAGMAMNDVADRDVDAMHDAKRDRSLASGSIAMRGGRAFCAALAISSVALASLAACGNDCGTCGNNFVGWTVANLALMAAYAAGAQRLFLVKNLLCGAFAISPLIGAATLTGGMQSMNGAGGDGAAVARLLQLAAIGFPLQVSREVLKDCEDTEVDRGVKRTLPLVVGIPNARRVAYALVAVVNAGMILSRDYWKMFASHPPVYATSVAVGTPMCIAASLLPLERGQRVLKKSIYVFLAGMISGLLLQGQGA